MPAWADDSPPPEPNALPPPDRSWPALTGTCGMNGRARRADDRGHPPWRGTAAFQSPHALPTWAPAPPPLFIAGVYPHLSTRIMPSDERPPVHRGGIPAVDATTKCP